jgi:hypothetical protein
LLDATLSELIPTEAVLGKYEVYYKIGRYVSNKDELAGAINKRFDDWCEANGQEKAATASSGASLSDPTSFSCTVAIGEETPDTIAPMKTAVVGPGGKLYLTDGHHTFTSFLEAPDGGAGLHVRVRITDNLSQLSISEFWQTMQDKRWVWLRDEYNQPITAVDLPPRLGLANFHDDPYRSLVYFTRDIGYVVPANAPESLEYRWGAWVRNSIDLGAYDLSNPTTYLELVKQASQAMAAMDAAEIVDGSLTAGELGKIAVWNNGQPATKGEFAKLGKAYSESKPGKLAYAFNYLADVIPPPACTSTMNGLHVTALSVESGVVCLDRARLLGPITVGRGGSLVVMGGEISGALLSRAADSLYLCGTVVTGPIAIRSTRGFVQIGGTGCTPNTIRGPVILAKNEGRVVLDGNEIAGPLMCVGNDPPPENDGRLNRVHGPVSPQCASL